MLGNKKMDSGLKYICVTAIGLILMACGESTLDKAVEKDKNIITISSSGSFNTVTGLMISLVARGGSGNFTWSVDDDNNATISENGDFIGLKEATVLVSAKDSTGRVGTATIIITDAAVLSISITPSSTTIVSGASQIYNVTTAFSNQTSAEITRQAIWSTDDPINISFPGPRGTVQSKPGFVGEAVIKVSFRDKSTQTTLIVEEPVIQVAAVDETVSVAIGTTLQMTAAGNASGNYSWSVGDSAISSIDNNGLLTISPTATTAGTINVTAADADSPNFFGSTTISIDPAVLQDITLTPSAAQTISTGNSIDYTVMGHYSDGTTPDITAQVAWSATQPAAVSFASGDAVETVTAQTGYPGRIDIEVSLDDMVVSTPLTILETTWQPINNGLYGGVVLSIAYHPTDSAILYAGLDNGGVYKSVNGGETWSAVNAGIEFQWVYDIAIDSRTPDTVYAGGSGLSKSIDGGKSWVDISGHVGAAANAVRIDPSDSKILYVGTNGGVYKSLDAGESWTLQVLDTLISSNESTNHLLIDPSTSPATLYAGTETAGVYKSNNGGDTWVAIKTGLTNLGINALGLDPVSPTTLYAATSDGLFKSINSGGKWVDISDPVWASRNINNFIIDPGAPNTFYLTTACPATTACGIYKSITAGASWTEMSMGPVTILRVNAISVDPKSAGNLYYGTNQGISRSINGGDTWTDQSTGLTNIHISTLQFDPITPTTLFAGTWYNGVFRSVDKGLNWTSVNGDLKNLIIKSLAIDPVTPGIYYAARYSYGVVKSEDGGGNWIRTNVGLENEESVSEIVIDPVTPSTVYVGTGSGVFRSTDSGATWLPIKVGLTSANNASIYAIRIDPTTTPPTLYTLSSGSVFKSVNGGGMWRAIYSGVSNLSILDVKLDSETPRTIYAQTGSGLLKSVNRGDSWVEYKKSCPTIIPVLAISPSSPNILYNGCFFGGLYISTNGGKEWALLNDLFARTSVRSLRVDPIDPSIVYVGIYGKGVYKVTTAGMQ